jgi:hypothetical protein
MARAAGLSDQAAFHSDLLPAPQSDRAALGRYAQKRHPQQTYATCAQFADAALDFLREKVPRNWAEFCDSVTDNFRVINPKDFRVVR